ncbi:Flagellar L-ring protein precursor [Rhodobacteraceae bacterium THAF1]|uniref:flagellar basal body L-ring protein FlgH n=1 Tax=Palleronia sp. THAF1 TaxID=2587842 RepID=UPI000F3B4C1A|nr:flagellar basal body L-ring protein FlgH [Palleronia sp. THAF1]QFU10284.1 Flagellar L-ring protein precursor [Palleronia sp. THAF1]VDC16811.1 Flagellar L-ring protein precursor [Rhodobacteraceae bacterium THAF1]
MRPILCLAILSFVTAPACGRINDVGRPPALSPVAQSPELVAMQSPGLPVSYEPERNTDAASLWSGGRGSLLGTRRAETRGDIVTVIVEIDDRAEFSNASDRSRSANSNMAINDFFGIPQRINEKLPEGANLNSAVGLSSGSGFSGDGSTSRNERLTLRVAATVTEVLPNGAFAIEGRQELRLNFELRELIVTGIVRPEDISRRNEVLYDKIAAARISYGGRGQITDVQQPRYGQQVADIILPF